MLTIQEFLREMGMFSNAKITYPSAPHDLPDCIVTLGNQVFWIEETSIFRKWDIEVSPNHHLFNALTETIQEFQINLVMRILSSIQKKDCNANYDPVTEEYGKGILLLRINDPFFFWQRDLQVLIAIFHQLKYKFKLNNFRSVYLYNFPVIVRKDEIKNLWKSEVVIDQKKIFLLLGEELIINE